MIYIYISNIVLSFHEMLKNKEEQPMAKGKQHPRLDKISKLPAQFSSKLHWSCSSIDQSTGRPKSNRNCWELQPRISCCDSAPTPAILLHSFDSKGVKTQLQNDWTMMTVKSKHSVSERPQLGNWDYEQMVKSGIQSNPPESNISSSNTIVTQV